MINQYELKIEDNNSIILDINSENSLLIKNTKDLIQDKHKKIKSRAKKLVISTIISDFFIILMTLISKIIHMIFTVLIIRIVSKKAYGIENVYLSFIHDIVISFPSQVIRSASSCYSHDQSPVIEKKNFIHSSKLLWLINFIIIILSFFLYYAFIFMEPSLINYKYHIILYIFSGIIENCVEPIMIYINIKVINSVKTFILFFNEILNLFTCYILCSKFNLDLWAFTLSRLITSILYCNLLFYLALSYNIDINLLIPNPKFLKESIIFFFNIIKKEDSELISLIKLELRAWSTDLFLKSIERVILSFFVTYSEDTKAEYLFVKGNFEFFIDKFISPTGDNFFILLNKIRNYPNIKNLRTINDTIEKGDFSFNDNQYIIKNLSNKNTTIKNESYPYKLLKAHIKLYLILELIIYIIFSILGNNFLLWLFTDKWVNETTYSLMKLFVLSISLNLIETTFIAYSAAIFETFNRQLIKGFGRANNFLLISLLFSLSQISIKGLVYAVIIKSTINILLNWYFTVRNEFWDINNQYIQRYIFKEMIYFVKDCSMQNSTLFYTCFSTISTYTLYLLMSYNYFNGLQNIVILAIDIINSINALIIIYLEKNQLTGILKIKIPN